MRFAFFVSSAESILKQDRISWMHDHERPPEPRLPFLILPASRAP